MVEQVLRLPKLAGGGKAKKLWPYAPLAVDAPCRRFYNARSSAALQIGEEMSGSQDNGRTTIETLCAEHGLRMTGQRRVIARVLSDAKDHPDVEEVHRRAHAADPRISLSTVYRTLKLLEAKGILERHDFGRGRGRYEAAEREHHDHLIDLNSGRVIEFRNEEIERLQEAIARQLGYKLVGHRLELYGVAQTAKKKKAE